MNLICFSLKPFISGSVCDELDKQIFKNISSDLQRRYLYVELKLQTVFISIMAVTYPPVGFLGGFFCWVFFPYLNKLR